VKTIDFEISSGLGPVVLKIYSDGRIDAPADALEYDKSMIEFGDGPSELLRFLESYQDSPLYNLFSWVIFKGKASENIDRGPREFLAASLAIDFAERTIPILEYYYPPKEWGYKYRDLIKIMRELIQTEMESWHRGENWIDSHDRLVLMSKVDETTESLPDEVEFRYGDDEYPARKSLTHRKRPVVEAVQAIASASGTRHRSNSSTASNAAVSAANAIGHFEYAKRHADASFYRDAESVRREQRWQIRRFVHVVWAMKNRKPYPSLKSTR